MVRLRAAHMLGNAFGRGLLRHFSGRCSFAQWLCDWSMCCAATTVHRPFLANGRNMVSPCDLRVLHLDLKRMSSSIIFFSEQFLQVCPQVHAQNRRKACIQLHAMGTLWDAFGHGLL